MDGQNKEETRVTKINFESILFFFSSLMVGTQLVSIIVYDGLWRLFIFFTSFDYESLFIEIMSFSTEKFIVSKSYYLLHLEDRSEIDTS
ncbi:hypothetical protein EYC84_000489 [Monilinia fructicola]|uniref:Uncharacterized protein n=1 Tax=Monilinia fructicola TaxID=38448 RepID=A0A5M9JNR7_MONFR|nr:hypothetical protein EYC84_000489 [Monilinia fructicola]